MREDGRKELSGVYNLNKDLSCLPGLEWTASPFSGDEGFQLRILLSSLQASIWNFPVCISYCWNIISLPSWDITSWILIFIYFPYLSTGVCEAFTGNGTPRKLTSLQWASPRRLRRWFCARAERNVLAPLQRFSSVF
ncbi:hypothetical protein NDU88_002245 [Pleurodeles waltl]|uniref:Uncharacterized protein n=1 Tax=Pleurodeles waltl TaxID=8319 RepID=A0AAV7W3H9_PLEWA|nr:hypothetical protein NDU88_002245 [Pleurodeles waltl]